MVTPYSNQYELIKESRRVLFEYCRTIASSDFVKENSSFGRGSIRNLLVHIGNTYEYWIGKIGLGRDMQFTPFDSIKDMMGVEQQFLLINALIEELLVRYPEFEKPGITFERNGDLTTSTPLKLFTHVITHEFHHKGQILSLSRHLGYTPIDTDVMQ